MSLIVQKFGGTSVGTIERIEQVADKVARFRADGHDVVVEAPVGHVMLLAAWLRMKYPGAGDGAIASAWAGPHAGSPGKHPLQEGAFLAPYPSPLDSNPEAKLPLEERSQDQRYYRFFRVGEVIPGASGKDHLRIFHVHSFGSYTEAQMSSLPNSVVEIPDVDEFINLSGRFPSTFLSLFTFMCECDASHRSRWR